MTIDFMAFHRRYDNERYILFICFCKNNILAVIYVNKQFPETD
mgnify:CR=1 FL=1|jgi:hypothetical protein